MESADQLKQRVREYIQTFVIGSTKTTKPKWIHVPTPLRTKLQNAYLQETYPDLVRQLSEANETVTDTEYAYREAMEKKLPDLKTKKDAYDAAVTMYRTLKFQSMKHSVEVFDGLFDDLVKERSKRQRLEKKLK